MPNTWDKQTKSEATKYFKNLKLKIHHSTGDD